MSTFNENRARITEARQQRRMAEDRFRSARNRAAAKSAELEVARREGEAGAKRAAALQREIVTLTKQLSAASEHLTSAKGRLRVAIVGLFEQIDPDKLVEEWDDHTPILLLPVRVETRFMQLEDKNELWVRIFPDDIAIDTHETDLTEDEVGDGRAYWREIVSARNLADDAERKEREKGAWRALSGAHGGSRASWVAAQTRGALTAEETDAGEAFWAAMTAAEAELDDETRQTLKDAARQELSKAYGPTRARWIAARTGPAPNPEEIAAGEAFWAAVGPPPAVSDAGESERRQVEADAWRTLAAEYNTLRAGRIAVATRPEAWPRVAADDVVFSCINLDEVASDSWSRAPRSYVLPDRFAVILQSQGKPSRTIFGAPVPDPLVVGPDPGADPPDIAQVNGDIHVSDEVRWMYDFDRAVEMGMGLKISLNPEEAANGFDQLLVVGLRLSSDADETRRLVEELIENHHHAPDGAGLVPQGTPTNNTEDGASGFISQDLDLDVEESLMTETGDALFTPTEEPDQRRDAQWLAEALGIDYDPLMHLGHADVADVAEARAMNRALWPATLGYYLEQILGFGADTVRAVESFFVEHVSGRGPLPAIQVGNQPYGVLVTSSFPGWKPLQRPNRSEPSPSKRIHGVIALLDGVWQNALSQVSYVGKEGDAFRHLLNILGLHATSVDYFRRHAVGSKYLWNYSQFLGQTWAAENVRQLHSYLAGAVLAELGWQPKVTPPILDLAFFKKANPIRDPLVDDVEKAEDEVWSEEEHVRRVYSVAGLAELQNYIGWLRHSDIRDIKAERFKGAENEDVPIPRPLLYRLLRHALLLANLDAALRLYEANGVVTVLARKEVELPNVQEERTVTRWEYLEARMDRVLPQVSAERIPVHTYLNSREGLAREQVSGLARVRNALENLIDLPTARLERLLAEHVDLCSYRLDAWQTALFTERLRALRDPKGTGKTADRALGLYLGAFGWLEEVRPAAVSPVPVDPNIVPESLREPENRPITEQPDNGGFIHGPSLNHAVAGAVLRNAYLTHATPAERDRMSVDLSSERVRVAKFYLEGIANGQPLGALLGYQFERGLKERHGDPSLAQYFPEFRNAYPMTTDKITPDEESNETDAKEARNVFDGYALLEKTLLADPPSGYPYNVEGLPSEGSGQGRAIRAEVERMAWALDAVGDLALAEGVYQVTQGNYDRAGAMIQAITKATHPPEPEILRTPRSGAAINHRVVLHFNPGGNAAVWTTDGTPRSKAEPALNAWFGEVLGEAKAIRYVVTYREPETEDATNSLADLKIEPIDLIHILGEELSNGESELVRRIRHGYRSAHPGREVLKVEFPPTHDDWGTGDRGLFSVMLLITALKQLVTGTRPLGANDYMLPSEGTTDTAADPNPNGYNAAELKARLDATVGEFSPIFERLRNTITGAETIDINTLGTAQRETKFSDLQSVLRDVAPYGYPDAFMESVPVPAHAGDEPTPFRLAWEQLLDLANSVKRQVEKRMAEAMQLKDFTDLDAEQIAALTVEQKVDRYRDAARKVLGPDFNLLPRFAMKNADELAAAQEFRDRAPDKGLIRYSADPLIAEEWFQGVARVRERLEILETMATLGDAFGKPVPILRPLQLPFRETDYWVAMEYPKAPPSIPDNAEAATPFLPVGDFLSVAQQLPSSGFDPTAPQTGLLVDAWSEVIPNRVETTGIAVHYNQPNTEPPQVLLLAVTPELTGAWKWEDLVAILEDTLKRAKLRAVEPDHLGESALGHFLPAVLTPTTSHPSATISADLVYQTAVQYSVSTVIRDG